MGTKRVTKATIITRQTETIKSLKSEIKRLNKATAGCVRCKTVLAALEKQDRNAS
jgi:hypothetical protein